MRRALCPAGRGRGGLSRGTSTGTTRSPSSRRDSINSAEAKARATAAVATVAITPRSIPRRGAAAVEGGERDYRTRRFTTSRLYPGARPF